MSDEVRVERRDGVLLITIDRPEARNALTRAVAEGVAAAVDELDASGDLRVGVLTGAGGTFSAGMDLKRFTTYDGLPQRRRGGVRAWQRSRSEQRSTHASPTTRKAARPA